MEKVKSAKQEIVYGIHAVQALIAKSPGIIVTLYIQEERNDQRINSLIQQAMAMGVRIERLASPVLETYVAEHHHQGVVAICSSFEKKITHDLEELLEHLDSPPLLLILDGVKDPHNLGACLRSANAAGAQAVIIPKDRAAPLTPVARKVACGAAATTPLITVTNLSRTMDWLKKHNIWIFGTSDNAERSIYEADLTAPAAFVLGAEEKGLRHLTREHCDYMLSIPMAGTVSSLNVSVATGVCLFEALRQRNYSKAK